MIRFLAFLVLSLTILSSSSIADPRTDTVIVGRIPRLWGLWLPVNDMDKAIRFYHDGCGLTIATRDFYPRTVSFRFEDYYLICFLVDSLSPHRGRTESKFEVNFCTRGLRDGTDTLQYYGSVEVDTASRESGIGGTIQFCDPFGQVGNLIQVDHAPTLKAIDVYNFGIQVNNMASARKFYVELLQCNVLTERYYPPTVPLAGPAGNFTFALHDLATRRASSMSFESSPRLILEVDSLEPMKFALLKENVSLLSDVPLAATYGKRIALQDPAGNLVELAQIRSSAFDSRPRKLAIP